MTRSLAVLRWRNLRWLLLVAAVPVLWACNARKLAEPQGEPRQVIKNRFQQSVNRDLDLLFVIDDSSSMAPLQEKMRARLPDFMDVLKALPGGLPNLHVAVVSTSLGAGIYSNVPGCSGRGNLNGSFQHQATCTQLNAGERFLKSVTLPTGERMNNFTGDITPAFSCIANIGDTGCGFEHQFEATKLALQRTFVPNDENEGFLRPQAYLAIVMITNEDDCSVPDASTLFDPAQLTVADPLGGLQSWRCNEFGHICDGPAPSPPHQPPAVGARVTLNNCRSREPNEDGKLTRVQDFIDFIKSLKASPDQILVAALAGPTTPYAVEGRNFQLGGGATSMEVQPSIVHSCTSGTAGTEYADPAVRIKQWLDGFGADRAVFDTICANDFRPAMVNIANVIGRALGAQCVMGNVLNKAGTTIPDCDVTQQTSDTVGNPVFENVPFCDPGNRVPPCWEFRQNPMQCPNGQVMTICYDAACMGNKPMTKTDALVSCSIGQ